MENKSFNKSLAYMTILMGAHSFAPVFKERRAPKHKCLRCRSPRPVDKNDNDIHGMFCSEECKQKFRQLNK